MYQLPETPTVDDIRKVAKQRDELVEQLEIEWKRTGAVSFTDLARSIEKISLVLPSLRRAAEVF